MDRYIGDCKHARSDGEIKRSKASPNPGTQQTGQTGTPARDSQPSGRADGSPFASQVWTSRRIEVGGGDQ